MHGIWNISLGAATILPVWAAPLPTGPAIAGETAESAPVVRLAGDGAAEATEGSALVHGGGRCADADSR